MNDQVAKSIVKQYSFIGHSTRGSHGHQVHKLEHYAIRGDDNRWIQNLLADRQHAIIEESRKSDLNRFDQV